MSQPPRPYCPRPLEELYIAKEHSDDKKKRYLMEIGVHKYIKPLYSGQGTE
jgi:hypothetical protein